MSGITAERNAASRFVDFSCVTPFEQLILALENAFKGVREDGQERHVSTYLSIDMCISIGDTRSLSSAKSLRVRYAGHTISHLFGYEGSFILISRLNNSWLLDGTATIKHTLFGAIITALHNCTMLNPTNQDANNFLPIFMTLLSEQALTTSSRSSDWQGYQIVTFPSTTRSNLSKSYDNSTTGSSTHGSTRVTKYSSKHQIFAPTRDGIAEMTWYRYVDNLQRLVEETYAYDNNYNTPTDRLTTAQVTEYYRIRSHTDISNMLMYHEDGVESTSNNDDTVHHPTHRVTVCLSVILAYPPGKIETLIDNEIHSTLVPARQSCSSW